MKQWTAEEIIKEAPCKDYPPEKIKKLFGTNTTMDIFQIFNLPIPYKDKMWAAWQTVTSYKDPYLEFLAVSAVIETIIQYEKKGLN